MNKATKGALTAVYQKLFEAFGPQKWWPARTPFEVIVGAILTQNTNWANVEKALANLKREKLLSPQALFNIPRKKLAALIRPVGYFNVKAERLKNFISFFFKEYQGRLTKMKQEEPELLRKKLLQVNGIGPETADSILLYALDKPIFVIDAYTKRILYRHNMIDHDADYDTVQKMFMKCLSSDAQMFNEYHALIVHLGKNFCKPKPLCGQCILNNTHYSLTLKCRSCHRALIKGEKEKRVKEGYLCQNCHAK